MSMTLKQLREAVYSRLDAEESSPAYPAIHADNLTRWINESVIDVILTINDPIHYQKLVEPDYSLTISSGSVALPNDFVKEITLLLGSGLKHTSIVDNEEFSRWDSSNFALTPTTNFPIATIKGNKLYVKPTSYESGTLDYIKNPDDLSSDSDTTSFSAVADNLLIELAVKKASQFLEFME